MNKSMMETPGQRSGPEEETGYGRKVRRRGRYSGLPPGGPCPRCGSSLSWPEMLVGTTEIGAFMRAHPKTINRWINEGRFPATKDGKNRWITTRRVIEVWMLKGMKHGMRRKEARMGIQEESRRQMQKDAEKEGMKDQRCLY